MKAGEAPGGTNPPAADVLRCLLRQAMLELNSEFRRLYEGKDRPLPHRWRVLKLTLLPKCVGASGLRRCRGISLIDALANLYIAALTRLLRAVVGQCAPAMYYRAMAFGYEAWAPSEQIGVGLGVLFQQANAWQH